MEAGSVDAIITDLPYGTTACSWDEIISFEPMWECVKRVLKPRGVFVTTARQPFTSKLIMSNLEWFKYELIWDKIGGVDFAQANRKPITVHENIEVFGLKNTTYNRIDDKGHSPYSDRRTTKASSTLGANGLTKRIPFENKTTRTPTTIKSIFPDNRYGLGSGLHPTQKPVALYEYLIRTYTNPGDTVLDFCMGSGTTMVSAIRTGRNGIGVESDPDYFAIAEKRIAEAQLQPALFQVDAPKPQAEQVELSL